jgi:hypothetical protein
MKMPDCSCHISELTDNNACTHVKKAKFEMHGVKTAASVNGLAVVPTDFSKVLCYIRSPPAVPVSQSRLVSQPKTSAYLRDAWLLLIFLKMNI